MQMADTGTARNSNDHCPPPPLHMLAYNTVQLSELGTKLIFLYSLYRYSLLDIYGYVLQSTSNVKSNDLVLVVYIPAETVSKSNHIWKPLHSV